MRRASSTRKHSTDYVLLPPEQPRPPKRRRCRALHACTLRRLFLCFAFTLSLLVLAILSQGVPSYDDVRAYERRLPQHSVKHGPARYLRFPAYLWGHGMNNVLQEALVISYLAYAANLSFVFEDYTWSHIPLPWTLDGLALRPTRIPMSALLSGPTVGGPVMQDTSRAPPAVAAEFYEHVCSGPDISPFVLSPANLSNDLDGSVIISHLQAQLAQVDAQCIELDSTTRDLFDRHFFGGPRFLSLVDLLITSPILRDFTWSPLVQSAVARNFAFFQSRPAQREFTSDRKDILGDMVALHLRRGDYVRHCYNLARWNAHYMGANQHPSLIDRFDPRPYDAGTREAYYLTHCLPTTAQVAARLRDVRAQHPGVLRRVYVLSNDSRWALRALKAALVEDGWTDVVSTADLRLDAAQYHVSAAVDMAVAERAAVFVGNGFSSLSANVVMLRLAKGMDTSSNRFL